MLLAPVGDRDRICCSAEQRRTDGSDDNSPRMKAQALDSDVGRTLPLKDDGTGGHMMYDEPSIRVQMTKDVAAFVRASVH
jgi:hypothetical protein